MPTLSSKFNEISTAGHMLDENGNQVVKHVQKGNKIYEFIDEELDEQDMV